MSLLDSGQAAARDYWLQATLLAFAGAVFRWLRQRATPASPQRFRGLLLYLTAIKEYETATATALFWQKQTELEKQKTEQEKATAIHWKQLFEACQSELRQTVPQMKSIGPGLDSADGSG